jgi:hypothetical protein
LIQQVSLKYDPRMQPVEDVQASAFVIFLCGPSPEGKFYVGQTSDFVRRNRDHQNARGECPHYHQAIQRFGWARLRPRIIAQTDIQEEADRLERLFITKYDSLFPNGYNLTLGGRATFYNRPTKVAEFEDTPGKGSGMNKCISKYHSAGNIHLFIPDPFSDPRNAKGIRAPASCSWV